MMEFSEKINDYIRGPQVMICLHCGEHSYMVSTDGLQCSTCQTKISKEEVIKFYEGDDE